MSLLIPIHEDNNLFIFLDEHPVFHQRTKHIDIRYYNIREHIVQNEIKLCQIDTNNQVADMLAILMKGVKFTDLHSLADMPSIRITRSWNIDEHEYII